MLTSGNQVIDNEGKLKFQISPIFVAHRTIGDVIPIKELFIS
jgi:hypothetical protein